MATIILDAGHGGSDFGATYLGRREKDDNLRLTLAVGRILENAGVNVLYTRTDDIYGLTQKGWSVAKKYTSKLPKHWRSTYHG